MDFAFADGRAFFCGLTGVGVARRFGILLGSGLCLLSVPVLLPLGVAIKTSSLVGLCEALSVFLSIGNSPLAHQAATVPEVPVPSG